MGWTGASWRATLWHMRPAAVLLATGLIASSVLVARLALDFTRLEPAIGAVVWVFAAVFVALVGAQVLLAWRSEGEAAQGAGLSRRARVGLSIAVPFALAGSQLDCMGALFTGCSPVCATLSTTVAPAVALVAVLNGFSSRRGVAVAMLAAALPLLVPNCVCRNPVNAYWIDLLGKSPACYTSSFAVTLVAASSLLTRKLVVPSLMFVWTTVGILATFFVGHFYFQWPW